MAKKPSAKKKALKAVKKSAKKAAPKKSKKAVVKKAAKKIAKKAVKKPVKKAPSKKSKNAAPPKAKKVVKKAVPKKTATKATPKPVKKAVPVKKAPKPIAPAKPKSLVKTSSSKSALTVSLAIVGFNTTVQAGPGQNNQLCFRYFSTAQKQLQVDRVSGFTSNDHTIERNIGNSSIRSQGRAKSAPDPLRKVVIRHELIVVFRSHPVNDQHHGGDKVIFNRDHSKDLEVTRETRLASLLENALSAIHLVEPTVPLLHDFLEGNFNEDLSTLAVKIRIHLEADTEEDRSEGCYVELFLRPGSPA